MATLISAATGNFTTSGTWKTVDTTSLSDSELANTALTTSPVASGTFTPGAITVDGIAVHLASVAGATGTITITLDKAGSTIATVTQNISTLPTCTTANNEGGWILFKFAAVTLLAATAYSVKASVSAGASAVNLYSSATTNWSRLLRQSTNTGAAAPTTGDVVYVMGELTGTAGTTSWTVTMDSTSTNQLGGVSICDYGTLAYGTTGSTAYYLKTIGNQASTPGVIVYSGGTLQMGTLATPMGSAATAVLELNAGSDGQYGLTVKNGGTLTTYGNTVTNVAAFLGADVAANAASFTTNISTGWSSGDIVAIASTTRTATDTEQITLGTVTTTTCNVSVGGGTGANTTKNAHSGTGATKAEVIHLTRNVKVRNASSSFGAYVDCKATSTVSCTYTEFSNLGANVTLQRGVEIETTTGTCTLDHCSIHDCRNYGLYLNTATGSVSVTNCCCYNLNTFNAGTASVVTVATSGAHTITGNYLLGCTGVNYGLDLGDVGGTISNNTVAGCSTPSAGLHLNESNALGTLSGNVMHSNSGYGLRLDGGSLTGTLASFTTWRNASGGININAAVPRVVFSSLVAFGNPTNIAILAAAIVELVSPNLQGDATFSTGTGINVAAGARMTIVSGSLGTTTTQSTDISCGAFQCSEVQLYNTTLGSGTAVSVAADVHSVRSHKHGGSSTTYKCFYNRGTVQADQTTRHTASGYSWKMTPNHATIPLRLPGPATLDTFRIPVTNGQTVTLSVWMQKDGSYNGTAPTITIVGGVIAGVGSAGTDIVTTATLTSANTWYQISCAAQTASEDGCLEFYISCNGTAGNLYVDDAALG